MKLKDITSDMVTRDGSTGKWAVEGLSSEPIYNLILENIKSKTPFSLSRYGDGEWSAIFEKGGSNCDQHQYFPDMGKELKRIVLSEPEYIAGIQPLTMSHYREQVVNFAGELDIDWVNSDVLHDANITENLKRFFDAIKGQHVIMVAPERLRKIHDKIQFEDFIEVPLKDCWLEKESIEKKLFEMLPQKEYCIILFCASMATNVMIDDMYKYYGKQHTFIDAGSIFDVHIGYNTRSYHKKMTV